jgi:hypothetical protein
VEIDGNYWTWMFGSHEKDHEGNYGDLGIPNESNMPSRRQAFGWTDFNGNLWLFGGRKTGNNKDYYSDMNYM